MQGSYGLSGFTTVSRRSAEQFSLLRMAARRPVFVSAAGVARALRNTRFKNDELLIQR